MLSGCLLLFFAVMTVFIPFFAFYFETANCFVRRKSLAEVCSLVFQTVFRVKVTSTERSDAVGPQKEVLTHASIDLFTPRHNKGQSSI